MSMNEPQPETAEQDTVQEPEDEKLEDLAPEDDEATDVHGGGFRVGRGRGGSRHG